MSKIRAFFILIVSACLQIMAATAVAQDHAPGVAERMGWQPGDTVLTVRASARMLPDYAFAGMSDLREVRFEEGSRLLRMGDFVFAGCTDLRRINLPPSLAEIGQGCFRECTSLTRFEWPDGVPEVSKASFLRCTSLKEVILPPRLKRVGDFAFAECRSLRRIDFPEGFAEVGMNSFSLCESIDTVTLPMSARKVESYAFSGCHNLKYAMLPPEGYTLGEQIFEDCPKLETILELSKGAPAFECNSYLADPVGDPEFYTRVSVIIPDGSEKSYRRAHCWKMFRHMYTESETAEAASEAVVAE